LRPQILSGPDSGWETIHRLHVAAIQEAALSSQNGALNPGALRNAIESLERGRKTLEALLTDKPAESAE